MYTEFIQALLLLLLFTCYHPFCQEHPKGFMLWPFAYCSFSHERWSINKHQGVWKLQEGENKLWIIRKKVSILWRLILKTFRYICSIQTLYLQTMSIFIHVFSQSLSLSVRLIFWFTTIWCDYAHSISSCIIAYHKASNIVGILFR